mgnify:FL=1|tara:strand:+ start:1112 stop:1912 length:801 start_codon:yes stop_codon:yes gene_type:complete
MINKENIYFIHANGYPASAYSPLFTKIQKSYDINHFNLVSENIDINNLKNWDPFHENFTKELKQNNNNIGIGHSIGGNLILRSVISHPNSFSKIILLDPTLFIPQFILFWKLIKFISLDDYFHPLSKKTLNRKMNYKNFDSIFKSYRKKNVFKYITDENLKIYINSITRTKADQSMEITFPKQWEYKIYKTGISEDNYIWKNIKNIDIPTLIIRAKESNTFFESAEKKINNINNKNIKIITIKKCSHLFPLEIPKDISKIILDYLN